MAVDPKYKKYKDNKTREKNKIKKIQKHLKTHPKNGVAEARMYELITLVKGK